MKSGKLSLFIFLGTSIFILFISLVFSVEGTDTDLGTKSHFLPLVHQSISGEIEVIASGSVAYMSHSPNSRFVVYQTNTNTTLPINIIYDRYSLITNTISLSDTTKVYYANAINDFGDTLILTARASSENGPQLLLHDVNTNTTMLIGEAEGPTNYGSFESVQWLSPNRSIIFHSAADTLLPNDANDPNYVDVFVYDLQSQQFDLISKSKDGQGGNGDSNFPSASGNGRLIGFISFATNLTSDSPNETRHVYLRNYQTGETSRIPKFYDFSYSHRWRVKLSANGRFLVSTPSGQGEDMPANEDTIRVFRYDLEARTLEEANTDVEMLDYAVNTQIMDVSPNGRFITFTAPIKCNNGAWVGGEMFLYDFQTGQTHRIGTGLRNSHVQHTLGEIETVKTAQFLTNQTLLLEAYYGNDINDRPVFAILIAGISNLLSNDSEQWCFR